MRKVWILLVFFPTILFAHDERKVFYDRIHLTASATAPVDNDTIIAVLSAQEEGEHAAKLADQVNKRVLWGMGLAKKSPQIKAQIQAYNTYPIYHENNITGWRVSQMLRLESQDMTEVSELLSDLQSKLNLQSISFRVSPKEKNAAENALISEALAAFNARAKLIANELGSTAFRMVDLSVSTSGSAPPLFRGKSMRMEMMSADVAAPSLEAGESTLTVTANGEIELIKVD
jgi:predicted secreted protein